MATIKNNLFVFIQIGLLAFTLDSCAPSRYVKPLEKGEKNIGFTFGGEMIEYGSGTIPLPLTSVVGGFGIDTGLTLFTGLHTTSLYFNNLQLDIGCTKNVYASKNGKTNISVSPVINFITDFDSPTTRLWPQLDINAYRFFGKKNHYAYLGISNWFELANKRANDQPIAQHWIFNPQMGTVFNLKNHWQFTAEIKLLAPNQENTYSFIPWKSMLGNYGATAVFIGISKTFK
ncbi:MAG TPA: hypothetical protein DIU39_02005 [Flavobacteriales bacterium]|nr:hypothetical protein [Flavobacteriales bacterium]|tara:strand:- start:61369 stop:62061 length:693 start_codon:yes stop_codon:yes gene_type:complete